MRSTIYHSSYSGDEMDTNEVVSKGKACIKSIHAELDGSFQRLEMQMLATEAQAQKLEEEITLLREHVSLSKAPAAEESAEMTGLRSDSFTPDEQRSFLARCLRSMRGDS